jgi:Tol biopolymer transport system component
MQITGVFRKSSDAHVAGAVTCIARREPEVSPHGEREGAVRTGRPRLLRKGGPMRPLLVMAAVLTAAFSVGIGNSQATYPGSTDGRVAVAVDVDATGAHTDIYTVMPNGVALQQLTNEPGAELCQSYSADGKEITYSSDQTGNFEIWTMKQNGKLQSQVTNLGLRSLFPDFSPGGGRIAFMSGTFANFDIYVVDRGSGVVTQLTSSPGLDGFPVYSPDGSKIAFISARSGLPQVWVMNADGTDPVQLTTDSAPKGQLPDWSPDGSQIAYQSMATGNGDIYVMNADGTNQHRLTFTPELEFGAAWSPDGDQIAFSRDFGSGVLGRAVYVANVDGSGEYRLADAARVPAWQPRDDRLD